MELHIQAINQYFVLLLIADLHPLPTASVHEVDAAFALSRQDSNATPQKTQTVAMYSRNGSKASSVIVLAAVATQNGIRAAAVTPEYLCQDNLRSTARLMFKTMRRVRAPRNMIP